MANSMQKKQESGFALLITLLVVTVLISIGLSVLTLSISQVRLASNARDSEVAFHAANAGMECGLYWRREESTRMEAGQTTPSLSCFGVGSNLGYGATSLSGVSGGDAYRYRYEYQWGTPVRCTQIDTIVGVADLDGGDLNIPNMRNYIPGYPGNNTKECEAGTRCTVVAVRGYNRSCGEINSFGTVQREVLLEL